MKVCKVVINSVSHDARVLKEAEAVREAGFDVTIIGIQDANNNIPIQIMENGVVIRRVAWQAEAFRPLYFTYLGKILLAVAVAIILLGLGQVAIGQLAEVVAAIKRWLTVGRLMTFIVAMAAVLIILFVAYQQWLEFRRRKKSYLALKKREEDELLKYEAIFSTYWGTSRAGQLDGSRSKQPSVDTAASTTAEREKSGQQGNERMSVRFPRPLMRGILKALAPDQIKRWKVILARENCIKRLLDEEHPAIVHAHDLTALPVVAEYSKKSGVKMIFDAHEIYDHLAQAEDDMAELNSLLLKKYAGRVSHFITINDSISTYYRNNYPALPPAVVVKNAAKLSEPIDYDGRLHETAGLSRDKQIVIYQGGYAAKRGLIQLLMSAEYLNPEWCLVYMGWGKLEDELRRVADALILKNEELGERIRFVPKVKQDELSYWSAGASVGVIPYENTGLNHWYCNPNKLWEYPNAGVPILASPFPEMSAIINKYELGWYLPDPLNPKVIAEVVNGLTDEQLVVASANCRRFMEDDNWNVYAHRLKSLYGELQ